MKILCTDTKRFINFSRNLFIFRNHTLNSLFRQAIRHIKSLRRLLPPQRVLLLAEGLAVGALIHGGICLVGAHQNVIQRAVVVGVTVVSALSYGAFDALVCIAVHSHDLLFLSSHLVCAFPKGELMEK
jgi:hypothetical protein